MALPEYMPAVAERMRRGDYREVYEEREITAAVDLCDARGRLNAAAVGWSRRPLVRANLRGHWPRKKRWNFWNWISPRFVFSVTVADIDYAAFCQVTFIDFDTQALARRHGDRAAGLDRDARARRAHDRVPRAYACATRTCRTAATMRIELRAERDGRRADRGDFVVAAAAGTGEPERRVPWTRDRFQLNSKHDTLPCEGSVRVGGDALRDGRPRLPRRAGLRARHLAVSLVLELGRRAPACRTACAIGVNVGARWTTGTGVNENGSCIDGRLHKVMEDLRWDYDPSDWMRPWRVRAAHSGMIDLTLEPIVAHRVADRAWASLAPAASAASVAGTARSASTARSWRSATLIGWAEEFAHRW